MESDKEYKHEDKIELYHTNKDFRAYIDGYCKMHNISIIRAFEHSVVENAFEYYKDANSGKMSVTEALYGCGSGELKTEEK